MVRSPVRTPRLPESGSSTEMAVKKVFSLDDIQTAVKPQPKRYGLHTKPGWGKTSLAAQAPKPIFIQTRGETGLETLIEANQLKPTSHFPEISTWSDLTAAVKFLRSGEHDFRTLVLDTMPGAERLCYEYVCERDFDGDWGERGFGGYQRGYEVAMADWRMFLNSLDELRSEKGMTLFCLFHSKIKTFKNPLGADYDRWGPDFQNEKAWALTLKWLDAVFFGNFETIVQMAQKRDESNPHKKGKALSSYRVMYTNEQPAFDAKNRMGLPDEIEMGDSPEEAWKNFVEALKAGRKVEEKHE